MFSASSLGCRYISFVLAAMNVLFLDLIGKPLRYCIGCGANRCTRCLRGKHQSAVRLLVEFQQAMGHGLNFLVKHGPDTNI
jgi:hypothetical protein